MCDLSHTQHYTVDGNISSNKCNWNFIPLGLVNALQRGPMQQSAVLAQQQQNQSQAQNQFQQAAQQQNQSQTPNQRSKSIQCQFHSKYYHLL